MTASPPRIRLGLFVALVISGAAPAANAQDDGWFPLGAEAVDELMLPLALAPDAVIAQALSAAGQPLDLVRAARVIEANGIEVARGRAGAWHPSVHALLALPLAVPILAASLDYTEWLGLAARDQPRDVLDSIQRLRHRAVAAGNLVANDTTEVSDLGRVLVVRPRDPERLRLPLYESERLGERAAPGEPPVVTHFPLIAGWSAAGHAIDWEGGRVVAPAASQGPAEPRQTRTSPEPERRTSPTRDVVRRSYPEPEAPRSAPGAPPLDAGRHDAFAEGYSPRSELNERMGVVVGPGALPGAVYRPSGSLNERMAGAGGMHDPFGDPSRSLNERMSTFVGPTTLAGPGTAFGGRGVHARPWSKRGAASRGEER